VLSLFSFLNLMLLTVNHLLVFVLLFDFNRLGLCLEILTKSKRMSVPNQLLIS